MGRLRRKRMHKNDKHLKKKYRTRRRTKDLDQIHEDMQPMNAAKLKSQECDMDLPDQDNGSKRGVTVGMGVKMLREVPYTTEEAERAAGMGSYTLTSTKPQLPVNEDEEMTNTERADRLAPNHLVIMK
ncbi:Zinc finger protein 593 [Stylophora pistillata]|uniref:Zinc finger protein 593 n=1 Tax=Stylophora pistillata TaxID=50429 RepID=A0A2B4R6E8_STYPI|nr:Zinc finger protein 593 [Stylophora pistillata]